MITGISGKIKAKAALIDPDRYGRSDTSPIGRWFWEIDKVLLLLVSVLIAHRADRGRRRLARRRAPLFGRRRCAFPSSIISGASWRGSRSACR